MPASLRYRRCAASTEAGTRCRRKAQDVTGLARGDRSGRNPHLFLREAYLCPVHRRAAIKTSVRLYPVAAPWKLDTRPAWTWEENGRSEGPR